LTAGFLIHKVGGVSKKFTNLPHPSFMLRSIIFCQMF
jgi:hypothetical protein